MAENLSLLAIWRQWTPLLRECRRLRRRLGGQSFRCRGRGSAFECRLESVLLDRSLDVVDGLIGLEQGRHRVGT